MGKNKTHKSASYQNHYMNWLKQDYIKHNILNMLYEFIWSRQLVEILKSLLPVNSTYYMKFPVNQSFPLIKLTIWNLMKPILITPSSLHMYTFHIANYVYTFHIANHTNIWHFILPYVYISYIFFHIAICIHVICTHFILPITQTFHILYYIPYKYISYSI